MVRKRKKVEICGMFVMSPHDPAYKKRISTKVSELFPDTERLMFCGGLHGLIITIRLPKPITNQKRGPLTTELVRFLKKVEGMKVTDRETGHTIVRVQCYKLNKDGSRREQVFRWY